MTDFDPATDILTINIDGRRDLHMAQEPNYPEAVNAFETALAARIKERATARGIEVRIVRAAWDSEEARGCDGDVGAAPGTADFIAADLWQSAQDDLSRWVAPAKRVDEAVAMLVDEGWDRDDVVAAVETTIAAGLSLQPQPEAGEKMLTADEIQQVIDQLS